MNVLGIKDLTESPSPEKIPPNLWLSDDTEREKYLNEVCEQVLNNYCTIRFNTQQYSDELDADEGQLYASDVLTLGLLYMNFVDAIREGDGLRIIRCYRYFLPLVRMSARTNYAKDILLLLYNIESNYSPREVQQLVWCRTVNTTGRAGHNIPCDLFVEHLNRLCKDMINGMGSNKTEKSITRIGKCVGPIKRVLDHYDNITGVSQVSQKHSEVNQQKDQSMILQCLMKSDVFGFQYGRSHKSFEKSVTVPMTTEISKDALKKWVCERMRECYILTINN